MHSEYQATKQTSSLSCKRYQAQCMHSYTENEASTKCNVDISHIHPIAYYSEGRNMNGKVTSPASSLHSCLLIEKVTEDRTVNICLQTTKPLIKRSEMNQTNLLFFKDKSVSEFSIISNIRTSVTGCNINFTAT